MQKVKVVDDTQVLSELIVKGIKEKKGHNILSLDLRQTDASVSDMFIICHGDSNRQVDAIAQSVDEIVSKETGQNPWHKEGFDNKEWILLDYINIVVHIFLKDKREFFALEDLWGDAKITHHNNID